MSHPVPTRCPACQTTMRVTELTCPACDTRVQGSFHPPALFQLTPEQAQFVEVFLRCRGNFKEVERELGISYPTVRARLDQVIQSLGYTPAAEPAAEAADAEGVLDQLGSGELTFEEALARLKEDRWSR
ncbi:DUF2089 domain-containing protein [Alicyclobacillus sp.]|uniref:DUF2089 domain-containing protein n=1 Tax=Alicyclobacillus sp. TaxID=61169 RepID=UPI0025B86140|nr:DUF2089 domain-containing protein [Alicyclobacillus sp.]MCL6516387.1 DUF2089 domain-containing protein [Alicyclobacillus sp.]